MEVAAVYQKVTDDMRRNGTWNCDFLDVYEDFLTTDGSILDIDVNFVGDLYLSPQGIRIIRACWLRHFGFFPPKGGK